MMQVFQNILILLILTADGIVKVNLMKYTEQYNNDIENTKSRDMYNFI